MKCIGGYLKKMDLVSEIKKKKEFKSLDDSFINNALNKVVKENRLDLVKDSEEIIKKTRAFLREVYGAFLSKGFNKREKLLSTVKDLGDLESHRKILKLHISTAERIPYYRQVYSSIFSITGEPKSILDIAAGLNPVSYPFLKFNPKYYAYELSRTDSEFLQRYFDKMKIDGKALYGDITQLSEMQKLPYADVCFLFKALDTLESVRWDVTKDLFSNIKCKWIVASFPMKSLGGGKIMHEKRLSWFFRLIFKFEYKKITIGDELFFVIRKA